MTLSVNIIRNCWLFDIHKASKVVTRFYDSFLRKHEITYEQFIGMACIHSYYFRSISEFSKILGSERTSASRCIFILSRLGYITQVKTYDKRRKQYVLTDIGYIKMEETYKCWQIANSKLKDLFDVDGKLALTQCVEFLEDLSERITKLVDQGE